MDNPFQPGDKVLILRKGVEMEATGRSTWNHEVQVRVADGELLWRTVNTAKLIAQTAHEVTPQPMAVPEVVEEQGAASEEAQEEIPETPPRRASSQSGATRP